MQVNGQWQQAGHAQSTHPHLGYNANGGNRGYGNSMSYSGVALIEHYNMDNIGLKQQHTQRENSFLALNNPLQASNYQDYYPNSAQNASNQSNTSILNQQVMVTQNTSVCGQPQSAGLNSSMMYYQSHANHQNTPNRRKRSRTEIVSVPMTNPATSSTKQRMSYTQQSAVRSPMYSQTSQQAACTTFPPSYTQSTNVPNAQNLEVYIVNPVSILSTTSVNKDVTNNQSAQNNYFVLQTNDNCVGQSVNGCAPRSDLMMATNAHIQSNSLTAVQTQYPSCQSQKQMQQTSVGGNVNMQTAQPVIVASNDNNGLNTSSVQFASQTCLQNNVSTQSNLKNMGAASLQTTMPIKDHSVGNSLFYQKMNEVSNNLTLCAPLNQASELSRCEAFTKTDTVSSVQAKECSLQVSPGRALRAVAVVLPLSQESSPSKDPPPSSLSSNLASDSCFFGSNQLDKTPVQTKKLPQSTGNRSISIDKADVQAFSPLNEIMLSAHKAGYKVSSLPLTLSQLVKGNCSAVLSGQQKSMSGNKKTPTVKKPHEEELSSAPTSEWTLRMLLEKIVKLEKKKEQEKTENIPDQYNFLRQIVCRFWNGDINALLNEATNGSLNKEMKMIKDFCSKINLQTVILSQNKSKYPTKYHVLLHDEVYEEMNSYTSSWLNVNQLDDIDKHFGLPFFFKYCKHDAKSVDAEPKDKLEDNQTEVKPAYVKPEDLVNKDNPSNPICSNSSMNSSSNNTDAEKMNTLAHSVQDTENIAEENKCVSNAQSNDSSYSFRIEVLPPEEAKIIFKQIEHESPLLEDVAVSEEMSPNDQDGAESQTCNVPTIEKICCIDKWKEKVFGVSSEGKCKCEEQNQDEEKRVQPQNKNGSMGTVDLTEDDTSIFTQEYIQKDESSNKSTIIVSSESEEESQVSENNYATHTDHHDEHEQDLVIFVEGQKDVGTNDNRLENSSANDHEMFTSDKSLTQVQDCRKEPEKNDAEIAACSQPVSAGNDVKENQRLASVNANSVLCPLKTDRLSSNLKSQTILESFSKCKNGRFDTVELALFGSRHNKYASGNSQQSHIHIKSSHMHTPSSFQKTEAPRRLYVKFSPFTKSDKKETEPMENISVKKRLHEKWRNSFPLSTIRLKKKNKKFAIVANHGTVVHFKPTKHHDKRVASKTKNQDSDDGRCQKKRRFHSNGKVGNTLKKPGDAEAMTLQENVLKYNVLPNTFSFKERSSDRGSTTDSKAEEKTVPVPTEGNPSIQTKGAWSDKSTSKSPESPASVPESAGIFQEFQKRYKMRQASMDD